MNQLTYELLDWIDPQKIDSRTIFYNPNRQAAESLISKKTYFYENDDQLELLIRKIATYKCEAQRKKRYIKKKTIKKIKVPFGSIDSYDNNICYLTDNYIEEIEELPCLTSWDRLSIKTSDPALIKLKNKQDKINWEIFSFNPAIFKLTKFSFAYILYTYAKQLKICMDSELLAQIYDYYIKLNDAIDKIEWTFLSVNISEYKRDLISEASDLGITIQKC